MAVAIAMLTKLVIIFIFIVLSVVRIKAGDKVIIVTCSLQIDGNEDSCMNASGGGSSSGPDTTSYYYLNRNCFDSINYTLTNDHSVLNITCDVKLSLVIELTNLTNITIIGHNNPTIDCNNNGGLHFISCSNVTIKGINWNLTRKCYWAKIQILS